MAENGDPGLHLVGKVIERISGPVSMYYLKPRSSMALRETKENLPLVLLWGDVHRDDSGKCEDCTCDTGDIECCYNIYDKPFLQELDKLATEYPVDFYTEYSKDMPDITRLNNPKNTLFHHFLDQATRDCHKKELRSVKNYEKRCPTRNIRWHYSDPRFMTNTLERSALEEPTGNLEYMTLSSPSAKSFTALAETKGKRNPTKIETLRKGLHEYANKLHVYVFYTHREKPDNASEQGQYDTWFALFLDILKAIRTKGTLEPIFSVLVKGIMAPDSRSALYKQIKKCSALLQDPHELVTFLSAVLRNNNPRVDTILHDLSTVSPAAQRFLDALLDPFSTFGKISSSTDLYQNLTKNDVDDVLYALRTISMTMFNINIMFVELYALLRMLKPPSGSSTPFLAMGYFGAKHTYQFVKMLQLAPYFDYEVVYSQDNVLPTMQKGPDFRCMTIDAPVYLAQDLEAHAHAIRAHAPYEKSYRNYQNVIEAERKGRLLDSDSDSDEKEDDAEDYAEDTDWEMFNTKHLERIVVNPTFNQYTRNTIRNILNKRKPVPAPVRQPIRPIQPIQSIQSIQPIQSRPVIKKQEKQKNKTNKKKPSAINSKGLNNFLKKFPSRKTGGKARSKKTRSTRQKRRTMKRRG